MGKTYTELSEDSKSVPYKLMRGNTDSVMLYSPSTDKQYAPEQIASYVLTSLVEEARAFLHCHLTEVVITVPAYFNDAQRQATKDAGSISSLSVQ